MQFHTLLIASKKKDLFICPNYPQIDFIHFYSIFVRVIKYLGTRMCKVRQTDLLPSLCLKPEGSLMVRRGLIYCLELILNRQRETLYLSDRVHLVTNRLIAIIGKSIQFYRAMNPKCVYLFSSNSTFMIIRFEFLNLSFRP